MSVATSTAIAIGIGAATATGTVIAAHEAASGQQAAAQTTATGATTAAQTSATAAEQAAADNLKAAQDALAFQEAAYTQKQGQVAPYINSGAGAVSALDTGLGITPGNTAGTVSLPNLASLGGNPTAPTVPVPGATITPPASGSGGPAVVAGTSTQLSTPTSPVVNPTSNPLAPATPTVAQPGTSTAVTPAANPTSPTSLATLGLQNQMAQAQTSSGVATPGTTRVVNGQLATWDGQGWVAA